MPNFDDIDLTNVIMDGDPYGEFEDPGGSGGSDFNPDDLPTSTNTPSDSDVILVKEDSTWYQKAFSKVWDYIKSKIQASSNEVAYGTCTTAAGTATKAVTLDTAGNWVLKKGCRVCVKFTNTNTFSATAKSPCKLNVNNTGAKNIYWGNSGNPTGTNTTAFGRANYINEYVYDGTYWVWAGSSADNNTTYSAMSQSELTTGTATTSRVVRADYLKAAILDLTNPVGTIIESTTCDTMAKVVAAYGGTTWIQHTGYVLRGATSGVNFNSDTNDGGADSVTVSSVASHNHTQNAHSHGTHIQASSGTPLGYWYTTGYGYKNDSAYTVTDSTTATNIANGSNYTVNTLPKYKNVYIWERTA